MKVLYNLIILSLALVEFAGADVTVEPYDVLGVSFDDEPYGYIGTLEGSGGIGSAFPVEKGVCLTAGHVVFNKSTSSWSAVSYSPQRNDAHREEKAVILCLGWSSYTANHPSNSTASPDQFNLDAAAVVLFDHGHSSLLKTKSEDVVEDLSLNNIEKVLIGYPEPHRFSNPNYSSLEQGIPFGTSPQSMVIDVADIEDGVPSDDHDFDLYYAPELHSAQGNSGGPLLVENVEGWYAGAILVGGGPGDGSVFKLINDEVEDLKALASLHYANIEGGALLTMEIDEYVSNSEFVIMDVSLQKTDLASSVDGLEVSIDDESEIEAIAYTEDKIRLFWDFDGFSRTSWAPIADILRDRENLVIKFKTSIETSGSNETYDIGPGCQHLTSSGWAEKISISNKIFFKDMSFPVVSITGDSVEFSCDYGSYSWEGPDSVVLYVRRKREGAFIQPIQCSRKLQQIASTNGLPTQGLCLLLHPWIGNTTTRQCSESSRLNQKSQRCRLGMLHKMSKVGIFR
ncbi:hypothetical protein IEN85_09855 [Pelagicoccus sp. NFK12]|uniref:Serine protease n=1 Tax=Pelagicoccus enzymogenes TaxID=2773457 RepID=A0A927F9N7_9BACT|nr:hypothetical protein [Pelagicoccus enzymogenes]MBD5779796.1 hypothetical protein [Pelagicoccus enzymogenes]